MAHILWAEDSSDDQELIRAALRNMLAPPEVEFVRDGVELLEQATSRRPGLIVLDLGMPRMGGLETLERLRDSGSRVGVIVFTSHGGQGEANQCYRRGANDVIQKPTGFLEFVATVQRIVTHSAWAMQTRQPAPTPVTPVTP